MSEEKSSIGNVNISDISDSEINIGSIVTSQTAGGDIIGRDKIIHIHKTEPLPPAEAQTRRDLNILLKNVETSWIKGVLEKSVHHTVLLDLGKEVRPEAVNHPWEMVLGRPDEPDRPLPAGTNISHIFQEMPLLLILGEPGSGKTITLLELARDLIAEVRADPTFTQPVPVVFNLSTWASKTQPLRDWIIEELRSKYKTPKRLGRPWLEQGRILPLLDGLDEVRRENRPACVEAINQFSADYGLQGLVICSRIKDYLELPARLNFYGAIYIRPLSDEQIDDYLAGAGGRLEGLHSLLKKDKDLRTLAQTPLMLNIMSWAYQGESVEDLSGPALNTDEVRHKHLFDTYVARMFKRRGSKWSDDEQTKRHLSWLAQNMQHHNQEVFLIEGLQPSWLYSRLWRWIYILTSRLISALMAGPGIGLILGMIVGFIVGLSEWVSGERSINFLIMGVLSGLAPGPILGLMGGLITGPIISIIDGIRFEREIHSVTKQGVNQSRQLAIDILTVGLTIGSIFGLAFGLSDGIIFGVGMGLILALASGLSFGLIFGLRGRQQSLAKDIQQVEVLSWSMRKATINARFGLIYGLIGGFIGWLIFGLILLILRFTGGMSTEVSFGLPEILKGGLLIVLVFGLVFGLGGAIFGGLNRTIIASRSKPNQGTYLSLRNAAFTGGISGLILGLLLGLNYELILGLSCGLFIGLLIALWYGGFDAVQHYILRFIFIIQGHTPRHYANFLDYSVNLIFLQKVGGGYRFIHRLLLEHFAAMGQDKEGYS